MSELVGVGLAALPERLAQFMRFIAVEIAAQQQIVRKAGKAADAAMAGAEGGLDRGQRERGAFSAISRVAAFSWSSGTTWLIIPSSSASRADIRGLRNQISLAFFLPTRSCR